MNESVWIVTQGAYSDKTILAGFLTAAETLSFCDKLKFTYDDVCVIHFQGSKKIAWYEYQKGGFVDGSLKLMWENK